MVRRGQRQNPLEAARCGQRVREDPTVERVRLAYRSDAWIWALAIWSAVAATLGVVSGVVFSSFYVLLMAIFPGAVAVYAASYLRGRPRQRRSD